VFFGPVIEYISVGLTWRASLYAQKDVEKPASAILNSSMYTQEIGAKIMTRRSFVPQVLDIENTCKHISQILPFFFLSFFYFCLYALLIFSVNSGTFSNKSPTRPTSATWKIGASASLLIAAITLLSFIPAKCWMAPEIPAQR
jgi:uncharacterized protein with PQ loop repeat